MCIHKVFIGRQSKGHQPLIWLVPFPLLARKTTITKEDYFISKRLEGLNKKMSELSKKKDGLKAREEQIKDEMEKERDWCIRKCGEHLYTIDIA